jgi:Phosphoribosyl transferase domain
LSEQPETAWESVYSCRPYHACWILGLRNPAFDKSTDGRLLDFKDGQEHAVTSETAEFSTSLSQLELPAGVLLAVIPGHKARDTNAGTPLARVVENLAKGDSRFVSSFETLIRFRGIHKLASGGDRSVAVHLNSIRVQQPPSVNGQTLVVLDDITTTGNSMDAARQLLASAGAIRIAGIALGRTVG